MRYSINYQYFSLRRVYRALKTNDFLNFNNFLTTRAILDLKMLLDRVYPDFVSIKNLK